MNKTTLLEETMTRIMKIREAQEAYGACVAMLRRGQRDYDAGDEKILSGLIRLELDEWRKLLLWGMVCDPATQDRVKAAAHDRFLSEKMSVVEWLNDGVLPSDWLSSDEETFRRMARAAFAPIENGGPDPPDANRPATLMHPLHEVLDEMSVRGGTAIRNIAAYFRSPLDPERHAAALIAFRDDLECYDHKISRKPH